MWLFCQSIDVSWNKELIGKISQGHERGYNDLYD